MTGVLATALFLAAVSAGPEDYTRDACPVVGNAKSRIYHTPASDDYRRLLKKNAHGEDYRVCFQTEEAAKKAGFRKTRR